MVTAEEILESLSAEFSLTPDDAGARGAAPAETFLVNGGPARVGVIGSVTRPFCGDCDRVRLTAEGLVRNCMFARVESNVRDPMRAGASDRELAALWRQAVASKLPGHGINEPGFLQLGPADVRHRRLTSPSCFLPCWRKTASPGRQVPVGRRVRSVSLATCLSRDLSLARAGPCLPNVSDISLTI